MNDLNDNIGTGETTSLKDYINLIRNNILPVTIITLTVLLVAIIYALNSINIYKATTSMKISKPQGSVLENAIMPGLQGFTDDRFIATEIEIMKSYNIRSSTARALIDSFKTISSPDSFYIILNRKTLSNNGKSKLLSIEKIAKKLKTDVDIKQKRGIDIIDISAESPSPYEAALIANSYANAYNHFNLEENRNQLTIVKNFLNKQSKEKQVELIQAEDTLSRFQAKGGIIALGEQAKAMIKQLSNFEAQRDAAKISLAASDKVLKSLKTELANQNPKIVAYLDKIASESYFKALQESLARLEVNKDLALADKSQSINKTVIIKKYNEKIQALKGQLNLKIDLYKASIFATSPEEIKDLTKKILSEEVNNKSLQIQVYELNLLVIQYESKFNKLPKTSIELARLERKREAAEKLYSLLEEKYQEAVINEQSQPGNVIIVDHARRPNLPSKPNRKLIVIIGLILGLGLSFGYVFIKNYFDTTIKTPEDIQNRNINLLSWIPRIPGLVNGSKDYEFIVAKKPDAAPSEAFRALRTRIQLSKIGTDALKTILVTSSTPLEGKTTVCVNLAGTFAQSNKKTLIIDCDLRKPRIHAVFGSQRFPGLVDYFFKQATLEEITRNTDVPNLSYITTGTIPPNPAETIDSEIMRSFLSEMRSSYDLVILDSAPLIAVTDSEILATMVDASVLVVSAEETEIELMENAIQLLKRDKSSFIGVVLNKFAYKSGYGSYYKYYYYYSRPSNGKKHGKASTEKS